MTQVLRTEATVQEAQKTFRKNTEDIPYASHRSGGFQMKLLLRKIKGTTGHLLRVSGF